MRKIKLYDTVIVDILSIVLYYILKGEAFLACKLYYFVTHYNCSIVFVDIQNINDLCLVMAYEEE